MVASGNNWFKLNELGYHQPIKSSAIYDDTQMRSLVAEIIPNLSRDHTGMDASRPVKDHIWGNDHPSVPRFFHVKASGFHGWTTRTIDTTIHSSSKILIQITGKIHNIVHYRTFFLWNHGVSSFLPVFFPGSPQNLLPDQLRRTRRNCPCRQVICCRPSAATAWGRPPGRPSWRVLWLWKIRKKKTDVDLFIQFIPIPSESVWWICMILSLLTSRLDSFKMF